ncbi:MAG: tetratricopeptide repeat protein [Fimbriiglobus sp.]
MRWIVPIIVGSLCGLLGVLSPWVVGEDRSPAEPMPLAVANAPDAITLAAEALDRGDTKDATKHLRDYVQQHPTALMPRAHYAELLFRQGQAGDARRQYERFISEAQSTTGPTHKHMVHCHTRLMQMAEDQDDVFHEYLNRGIGLSLVTGADEPTLAKSLEALLVAEREKPDSARVHFYLSVVYGKLRQPTSAQLAHRRALAALPDPSLTPHERAQLKATSDTSIRAK